jgi:serine protease Do
MSKSSFQTPRRAALAAVLLAGTALGGLAVGHAQTPAPAPATPAAGAIQPAPALHAMPDFADLVSQVRPAVVSITTHMAEGPGGAKGSGFLIAANGTVVTNNHVVRGASKIEVQLDDGTVLPAKLVGRDPRTDLAVLHIDSSKKLPFLDLGDSAAVRPGQWVVAVGNPFGLGGTVTAGIVSARGRELGSSAYDDFLQIDAPINAGNSGGPLFSQDGKVVGVNTAILSPTGGSVGIGFAIPADLVRTVVSQLETSGKVTRGYLGVETQALTADIRSSLRLDSGTKGALVAAVEKDGPAAKAGLQAGDVVTSVSGKAVATPRALAQAVADVAPGGDVTLGIVRDGDTRTLTAKAATQPGEDQTASAEDGENRPTIGVALAPLAPELRDKLDVPEGTKGAVIAEVKPGSPAEEAGLRAGDVLVSVAGRTVASPEEAAGAVRTATAKDASKPIALRVMRDGRARFVAVTPALPKAG